MTKRLSVLVPTAFAIGTLLLAACDQAGPAAGAGQNTEVPTSGSSTGAAPESTGDPVDDKAASQPVDCGEIKLDTGATHTLIADPTASAQVGCTEAFNVIDAYLTLPAEKRAESALGNVNVADGWSCTVDDGETASIGCAKDSELAFHTEPVSA